MSLLWVLHPHPSTALYAESELEVQALEELGIPHGYLLSEIPAGSLVVPRFRALPFGRELEEEAKALGLTLLNSYAQHRFAADLGAWYPELRGLTPESWPSVLDIPQSHSGPFILKGETNSRRHLWSTHCYAETRGDIGPVISNLLDDSLLQHQRLWIREFVRLNILTTDVVGMPIGEEYRVFFLDGKTLAGGFYWVNHLEDIDFEPSLDRLNEGVVNRVGRATAPHIRFAAVDFGILEGGGTLVIEVNDGSMAGLCGVDPLELWSRVRSNL